MFQTEESPSNDCRLCNSGTNLRFVLRVLEKYDVEYRECPHCHSLQTTAPFWLSETYSRSLPNLDIGAARRTLKSCSAVLLASRILSLHRDSTVLDFGGGDGFVCRILRDLGFDAVVYDKYARNTYADGFEGKPDGKYDIICALEVWEHLASPKEEIDLIFAQRPNMVLVSTDMYDRQGADWTYLGPDQGGHVFFYSAEAMKFVAARYGYDVVVEGSTSVFSKSGISLWRRIALSTALKPIGLLFGRLWLQLIKPRRNRG